MNRKSTSARLLLLLLLPVVFGCQMHAKGPQGEHLVPREQASPKDGAGRTALKDQGDKIAYSIGLDVGRDLQKLKIKDPEPLLQGIRDSLQGNEPLLTAKEIEVMRTAFIADRISAEAKAMGPQAEKNLLEGEAFLRENGKKEGVRTLPSGLQYRILKEGTGASPAPEQNVKAHYVVRSIGGTEFENTYKVGTPAVFPVNGVIPAWTEALQLMKEGDKWELFVPAVLAYGDKGVGEAIGPFQVVIFEIELLSIH